MIFQFRMLSDEDDNFYRDYAVPYDMTLLDLHRFLCADLRFDTGQMSSFFTSDKLWNRLHEFTLIDMGFDTEPDAEGPRPMESVLLSQVIAHSQDRLIYGFDPLEERALYLELTHTLKAEPGKTYPVVVAANGPAPRQFEIGEGIGDSGSVFDEAMSDFDDFEGDDAYGDDD